MSLPPPAALLLLRSADIEHGLRRQNTLWAMRNKSFGCRETPAYGAIDGCNIDPSCCVSVDICEQWYAL